MTHPTQFPTTSTHFLLEGPAGSLEVAVDVSDVVSTDVAILCHPHPLYGGTMNNKVITTAARAFNDVGIQAVRFNYRGVGESEGEFGQVLGEAADGAAVIQWVRSCFPQTRFWLCGFSFGSAVAAQLARDIAAQQLITLAPAVHHYDFDQFTDLTLPWTVIQGEIDEIVPPQDVYAWVDRMPRTIDLKKLPDTSHFFHKKLLVLRDLLKEVIVR